MMTELGVLDTSGKEKEQRVHPKNSWKNNRIKPGDIEKNMEETAILAGDRGLSI